MPHSFHTDYLWVWSTCRWILSMSFSHTQHLLTTQIVRWPGRIGRVQLDQPLADCRLHDGASSRLYEPGYIVLEEERIDSGQGIDRVVYYDIYCWGGAREGQGLTAQGLGTHPGWLAHVRGATWCGKNFLGHMIHPLGIATYSRATVQGYPSGAHSSPHIVFLKYDFIISAEYWFDAYCCQFILLYSLDWYYYRCKFLRHTVLYGFI